MWGVVPVGPGPRPGRVEQSSAAGRKRRVPHFSRPLREVGTLILKEVFAGKWPLRLTPSPPNCQTSLPRRSTKPLIGAASTISQEVSPVFPIASRYTPTFLALVLAAA